MTLGMPILGEDDMFEARRNPMNHRDHGVSLGNRQWTACTKVVLHIDNNERVAGCDLHVRLLSLGRCYNWRQDAMPALHRILPALLLLCCFPLPPSSQNPAPAQSAGAPTSKATQVPGGKASSTQAANPAQTTAAPEYSDPCAANATTVDFDTCYADLFKLTDQDLNHLYRNTLLAFEAEVADAYKRSDQSQLGYDATAIGDLKAAQAAWIQYRDLECRAAGQQLQGGSIQPIVVNKCMILVTRHRIDDIRAAYEIGGRNLE